MIGCFLKMVTNHRGTGHKLAHNLTTLLNIPLFVWLVYTIISLKSANYSEFTAWFNEPLNLVAGIALIVVALTHFTLELEVVFEDYISNVGARKAVILAMKIFWFVLGLAATISLINI